MLVHIIIPHHHHSSEIVVVDWNYSPTHSMDQEEDSQSSCSTTSHHHNHTILENCLLQETVLTPIKAFQAKSSIIHLLYPIEAPLMLTDIKLMSILFIKSAYIPPNLNYFFNYIPRSQGVRGSPLC